MAWKVEISPAAEAELDKLSSANAKRILKFLYERIANRDGPCSTDKALAGSKAALGS
jgi:mRNA interferase RelE/StbE